MLFCSNNLRESQRGNSTNFVCSGGQGQELWVPCLHSMAVIPNCPVLLWQTQGWDVSIYSKQVRMWWEDGSAGRDKVTPVPCGAGWLSRRLPGVWGLRAGAHYCHILTAVRTMLCQAPLHSGRLRALPFPLMQAATPEPVQHRENVSHRSAGWAGLCMLRDCHEKLQLL